MELAINVLSLYRVNNMKRISQSIFEYTVVFEPAEGGGFAAFVPTLPGCYSQGDTFEEARENIKDAIELHLDVLKERGIQIPREVNQPVFARVSARFAQ